MIVDIHTHMGDVIGGYKTLSGEEQESYKKWVPDLSDTIKYLRFLEEKAVMYTGEAKAYCCVLAVEPNTNSEELISIHRKESRIIPFISPDFSLPIEDTLLNINRMSSSSFGMKIHPIIQDIRTNDEKVYRVLEQYAQCKKPVIFHTGASDYRNYYKSCPYDMNKSNAEDTLEIVKAFPSIPFILGHAGMFEHHKWAQKLSGIKNVWIDTSFKYADELIYLAQMYGVDHLLFGSDFPFYDISDWDDLLKAFSKEDLLKILGQNTQAFWNLD